MNKLLYIDIPVDFVLSMTMPTASEIVYGFQNNLLSASGLVELEEMRLRRGLRLTEPQIAIASLLPPEIEQAPKLVSELASEQMARGDEYRVWLFLALAWLLERRRHVSDPLEVVEMLFEDFDHPQEMFGLIRYMPLQAGLEVGTDAILKRWIRLVDEWKVEFGDRSVDVT